MAKIKLKDQLGRVVRIPAESKQTTIVEKPTAAGTPSASPTLWKLIREVPANIQKLAALVGNGFATRRDDGEWALRTLQQAPGIGIVITNGDGEAGDPTIGLADLANTGTGSLLAFTRDSKGRVTGTKSATITGTPNQITVANGTAVAGLPTLSLAPAVLTSLGEADSAVQSIVAGAGVTVNNADTRNPIVSATGGGGGFVPYSVPDGQSFTVPINQQALFTLPINLGDGSSLVLDGALVEVS